MQRRRGEPVTIALAIDRVDLRGNVVRMPTKTSPRVKARAWQYSDRSSKAEVPGQMDIDVIRLGVESRDPNFELMDIFARIQWQGHWWDLVAPPTHQTGVRQTRHKTLTARRRPDDGGFADG